MRYCLIEAAYGLISSAISNLYMLVPHLPNTLENLNLSRVAGTTLGHWLLDVGVYIKQHKSGDGSLTEACYNRNTIASIYFANGCSKCGLQRN